MHKEAHEKCDRSPKARGNSLSIPGAHQWRFHVRIPSSLQMRRRPSVDLSPVLKSSHNCPCCVLGKAGVQSKYFQAERGSGTAGRSTRVIWSLEFFSFFCWSLWREREPPPPPPVAPILIKLKGLPHFWKMRLASAPSLLHSRRRGEREGSNGERD